MEEFPKSGRGIGGDVIRLAESQVPLAPDPSVQPCRPLSLWLIDAPSFALSPRTQWSTLDTLNAGSSSHLKD